MTPQTTAFLLCTLLGGTMALISRSANSQTASPPVPRRLAYHDHLSATPLLPDTLDPAQFLNSRSAFVAYSLAARVKETLYQVPCYCHCDRERGHQSLLDCFTDKHGALCVICQKEAIFCFLQKQKGKNPAEIREAMAKGEALQLDLSKYSDRFFAEIKSPVK
jgi:hypothetical protein